MKPTVTTVNTTFCFESYVVNNPKYELNIAKRTENTVDTMFKPWKFIESISSYPLKFERERRIDWP